MSSLTFSEQQIHQFHIDGFVIVPGLFDAEEMSLLREAASGDDTLRTGALESADGEGGSVRLALWNEEGDDIYGMFSRSRRVVDNIELLLGEEVYHYHSKMIQKDARTGGAWEWHQDYGYWYEIGILYPRLVSCFIAVDRCTRENGCLQVLPRSHQLGRIDHGPIGDQTGADPERVKQAIQRHEVVYCEMEIGDAVFFHCNLLHRSDQNRSEQPRWSLISCYNAASNSPYKPSRHADYHPLIKVDDDAIKACGTEVTNKEFYKPSRQSS